MATPIPDTSTRDANTGDEGDDLNMSLAAMEDAIRDHMMDVFDQIATLFKQFTRSQDRRLAKMANDEPLSPRTEANHLDLKIKLVELMEGVNFHANRIEALSDQLFTLNKHVTKIEGRLLTTATAAGVPRAASGSLDEPRMCRELAGRRLPQQPVAQAEGAAS